MGIDALVGGDLAARIRLEPHIAQQTQIAGRDIR